MSHVKRPTQLPSAEWWLAQVVQCCTVLQTAPARDPLGFFKIRWLYDLRHFDEDPTLNKLINLKRNQKLLKKYNFWKGKASPAPLPADFPPD